MNIKIPADFSLEHSRLNPLEEGLKTLGVALGYKTQIVLASVSPLLESSGVKDISSEAIERFNQLKSDVIALNNTRRT
jgi:hypothetical protein